MTKDVRRYDAGEPQQLAPKGIVREPERYPSRRQMKRIKQLCVTYMRWICCASEPCLLVAATACQFRITTFWVRLGSAAGARLLALRADAP